MVDIHCHILPAIDDGPGHMDESVAMAHMAAADGITHIVATPHIKHELIEPSRIAALIKELNQRLGAQGVELTVLGGADVSAVLDPSLLKSYTINGTDYILIEFPHTHLPSNAKHVVFGFAAKGFRPIVTHPERNISVIKEPSLAQGLVDSGGLLQVTGGSLTGEFGAEAKKCAISLLKKGLVHFIASDAHSVSWRPPVLSFALEAAASLVGLDNARVLVHDNPGKIISGNGLPA